MRHFLYGLVIGTGLGYAFHEDIDQFLRETLGKANEKLENADAKLAEYDVTKSSIKYPATGANLPFERIEEINNSTPESPVYLTEDEMEEMNQTHLRIALGAGRIRIADGGTPYSEPEST